MDLKSGTPLWPDISPQAGTIKAPEQNLRCDVAVVGAGLSGALTAYRLAQAGLDVVILDKRIAGCGSTALVLYEVDVPLVELSRQRGTKDAVKCYQACHEAIGRLERLIKQIGGRCGFRRRDSLYMACHPDDLPVLVQEFEARKKAGFKVQLLDANAIRKRFSFIAPGAIYSEEAAEVNPLALTRALLRRAQSKGVRMFGNDAVKRIRQKGPDVSLCTIKGWRIDAKWAVVASGFATHSAAIRRVVKLKSSYAFASKPVHSFKGWHRRCLIWETARPYLYLRTTADRRVIVGGEDEDFVDARRRDGLIKKKSAILAQKCAAIFPIMQIARDYCWAGTFGETKDGLPYIGPLKEGSRILYALCFGANGTNFAILAADILLDMTLGKPNRQERLFRFGR